MNMTSLICVSFAFVVTGFIVYLFMKHNNTTPTVVDDLSDSDETIEKELEQTTCNGCGNCRTDKDGYISF